MGHAMFLLEDYSDAVDAYEKGLKLDPENATMKQSLETARKKMGSSAPVAAAGGMPDMGGLAGMMNNPAMMDMAKNVWIGRLIGR